jgi:hypothetical protein
MNNVIQYLMSGAALRTTLVRFGAAVIGCFLGFGGRFSLLYFGVAPSWYFSRLSAVLLQLSIGVLGICGGGGHRSGFGFCFKVMGLVSGWFHVCDRSGSCFCFMA